MTSADATAEVIFLSAFMLDLSTHPDFQRRLFIEN